MRVPPTHGTSAYKYEGVYTPQKKKTVRQAPKKNKIPASTVIGLTLVIALAFVLLFRYSYITELTANASNLEKKYEELNSVAVAKRFNLEQNIDLKKIEEIAVTELDMQRPEKHQFVYIDMQNGDYTEKTETGENRLFASISGIWTRVWEYFA